jgi:hypothetical protein
MVECPHCLVLAKKMYGHVRCELCGGSVRTTLYVHDEALVEITSRPVLVEIACAYRLAGLDAALAYRFRKVGEDV